MYNQEFKLSPLFDSVTAGLTIITSVSPHGAPHEAFNRLHEGTYMAKYEDILKYDIKDAIGIFCLGKTCCQHLLPRGGGIF